MIKIRAKSMSSKSVRIQRPNYLSIKSELPAWRKMDPSIQGTCTWRWGIVNKGHASLPLFRNKMIPQSLITWMWPLRWGSPLQQLQHCMSSGVPIVSHLKVWTNDPRRSLGIDAHVDISKRVRVHPSPGLVRILPICIATLIIGPYCNKRRRTRVKRVVPSAETQEIMSMIDRNHSLNSHGQAMARPREALGDVWVAWQVDMIGEQRSFWNFATWKGIISLIRTAPGVGCKYLCEDLYCERNL